ncbi:hypothetical protein [Streptomyces sp. NRRL WC-3742]|uniref:hypothetical protein n=1 Tax=Streptomyces sp. NRRL WC-3742 TaxID=1463934 RepID=UPI000ABDBBA5|nr:hypothetical protein [Streptomyces sp. NRRL WC-3742]
MAARTVGAAWRRRGASQRPVALAEAALVRHYRRLVRLAYLALPADRDRHTRVLAAHAAVQRALPPPWPRRAEQAPAAEQPPAEDEEYARLRLRVLRTALRPHPAHRLLAPRVWGLRLFTPHGGEEDAALDHALTALDAPTRAAYALRAVEGLAPEAATEVLRAAGVERPEEAVAAAAEAPGGPSPEPPAFDPCAVRVQPTDLLRRRRTLTAALAVAVLGLTTTAAVLGDSAPAAAPQGAPPPGAAVDRARLVQVAPDAWQHTTRVDFDVWPARGDRREDTALLDRALGAWARPGPQTHAEPGTDPAPPAAPPHLLYAGTVDGTGVVVLYDGRRLARYADGPGNGPGGGLDLARADGADPATAGALVLRRQGAAVRYLLAPWVEDADTRRIDQPDAPARPLEHPDGITAPAPGGGLADCHGATVLQLHASPAIADRGAFLLADLGGLVPAHLTWSPPDRNQPQSQSQSQSQAQAQSPPQPEAGPREAVAQDALQAWSRAGCAVPDGSPGVRQLSLWAFATQQLPQNAGSAAWYCLRADRWNGDGSAATAVLLPNARAPQRTGGGQGRACSRYEPEVAAWAWWRSPQGTEYLLAAGSRRTTRLAVKGPDWSTDRAAPDHTLALERPARAPVQVEALLDGGARITAQH